MNTTRFKIIVLSVILVFTGAFGGLFIIKVGTQASQAYNRIMQDEPLPTLQNTPRPAVQLTVDKVFSEEPKKQQIMDTMFTCQTLPTLGNQELTGKPLEAFQKHLSHGVLQTGM
jgi:hypothetical protein